MVNWIKSFIFLLITAGSCHAQNALPVLLQTYPIEAKSQNEILNAIATQSPPSPKQPKMAGGVIIGWTVFQWGEIKVFAKDVSGGCEVNKIDPTGRLVIFYPKLKNSGVESQTWLATFERFGESVRQHENKHVLIYQDSWKDLINWTRSQENRIHQTSCDQYKKVLHSTFLKWPDKSDQEHVRLDTSEGHISLEVLQKAFGLN